MAKFINKNSDQRRLSLCLLKCIDENIGRDLTEKEIDKIVDSLYFGKQYEKGVVAELDKSLDLLVKNYDGGNLPSSTKEGLRHLLDQLVALHYHSDISRITTMVAVMIIIQTYEQIYNGTHRQDISRSESISRFVMSRSPENDIAKKDVNEVSDGNGSVLSKIARGMFSSIFNRGDVSGLLISNLSREGSIAIISTIFMLERDILTEPKNFRRMESEELLNQVQCMFDQEWYTELPKIERCNKADSVVVGLGTSSGALAVAGVAIPVIFPEELVIIIVPSLLLSIALSLGVMSLTRLIVNAHVPDKFVEANAQPAANTHILELMTAV